VSATNSERTFLPLRKMTQTATRARPPGNKKTFYTSIRCARRRDAHASTDQPRELASRSATVDEAENPAVIDNLGFLGVSTASPRGSPARRRGRGNEWHRLALDAEGDHLTVPFCDKAMISARRTERFQIAARLRGRSRPTVRPSSLHLTYTE